MPGRRSAVDIASRLHWQVAGCVLLAAVSLAWSTELEYDPWTWLVWARESTHLDLVTSSGPAWKPLPVMVDAVLVPLGGAAPAVWSLLVRSAGLIALVAAGRLAALLARPRLLAAALAVLGTALSAQFLLGLVPLGYSEPILAALLLLAGEAVVRHRPHAAFGLLLAASLLRPEAWPLLLLAALWLLRRERSALPLVMAGLVGLAAAWFLPDYLSSGDWARSTRRAANPTEGGVLLGSHPAVSLLLQALRTPAPPWVVAFAATTTMLWPRWSPATRRPLAILAAATIGWAIVEAVLVAVGSSSGETRYLIGWTIGVPVIGSVGAAEAVVGAARHLRKHDPRHRLSVAATASLVVLATIGSVPRLAGMDRDLRSTRDHTSSYRSMYAAIRALGGAQAIQRCGAVGTEPRHVPVVAWRLHRHLNQISSRTVAPGTTLALSSSGHLVPTPPPGAPSAVSPPWYAWRSC